MAAKETSFDRRKRRTRFKVKTCSTTGLRLTVFRSSKHIHTQLVDDTKGITIAAASSVDKELKKKLKSGSNVEAAKEVGTLIAKRAKEAKVSKVAFDRGGYMYHGRVKALAEAARAAGLVF